MSNYKDTDLRRGNFSGQELKKEDFSGSNLILANFVGADLRGADFTGAILHDADFTGANLMKAKFNMAQMEGVILNGADFSYAVFKNANLRESRICHATGDHAAFISSRLQRAKIIGSSMMNAKFEGAKMEGVNIHHVDLRYSYLSYGADLKHAQIIDTNLWGCQMIGAWAQRATFEECDLTKSVFDEGAFEGAMFTRCCLRQTSFEGTTLSNAKITDCYLDWQNHHLIGNMLKKAAIEEGKFGYVIAGGYIEANDRLCFAELWKHNLCPPEVTEWAMKKMASWVKEDDTIPRILKRYITDSEEK